MAAKLSCNTTCGIIKAMTKSDQRYIVFLEIATSHGLDVSPLYHPLDVCKSEMLREFSKLGRIHLFVLKPTITIMLRLVPIRWNKWRMSQFKLLIQPHLRERKRKREWWVEKGEIKKKKRKKKRKRERNIQRWYKEPRWV